MKLKLNRDPIYLCNFAAILGDPSENTRDCTCGSLKSTIRHPGRIHAAWEVASSLANCMQAGMSEIHSPGAVEGIGSQMPGSHDAPEYSI